MSKKLKDYQKDYQKEYYAKNKDKVQAKAKKWKEDNPERYRELAKLSARKRRAEGRDSQRRRQAEYKTKAIELLGGKCARCYNSFPIECYDFHHTNPAEKELLVSKILRGTWSKIEKEVLKCELLCANCHRIEHGSKTWPNPLLEHN